MRRDSGRGLAPDSLRGCEEERSVADAEDDVADVDDVASTMPPPALEVGRGAGAGAGDGEVDGRCGVGGTGVAGRGFRPVVGFGACGAGRAEGFAGAGCATGTGREAS